MATPLALQLISEVASTNRLQDYNNLHFSPPPDIPQSVTTIATDTSVLITWQPGVTLPDHYNIVFTYTSNSSFSNQTHTSTIQVPGTATSLDYDQLVPQQEYAYCVSAIYGQQMSSFCFTFRTESQHTSGSASTNSPAVGILSFLIVLLKDEGQEIPLKVR